LDRTQNHVIFQTIHQEVEEEEKEVFLVTKQIGQESKERNKSQ
jgi:hypothetical protein